MKKENKKPWIGTLLLHLLVAFTATMLIDFLLVTQFLALSMVKFAVVFAGCFLLSFLGTLFGGKTWKVISVSLSVAVWMLVAAGLLCWKDVSQDAGYIAVDNGKAELYAGQKVMLLVPHQDDDINVLGGVIEEYTKYGSEVYIVYSTNGDYEGLADIRMTEAVTAAAAMGVPRDHVIFLGYGDQWDPSGPHIYNAEPGVVLRSVYGSTETYGTDHHRVYREGTPYTIDNFLADIESVILEYRPDVLYCIDYDYRIDHKALMLSFEKVVGRILNTLQDYRPRVFKGYAYSTAWEAEADYYGENLASTQNVFAEPYLQKPEIYRWEDRIRLPVHGENLSRSLVRSKAYEILSLYESQDAGLCAGRVYNSDKVFWERRTDSLCHGVALQTSSGEPKLLNDFMLVDNHHLTDTFDLPYDGVWIPEAGDTDRTVTVTLPQPETVTMVSVYDHPDPAKNVLDAVITFDDGSYVRTGPLHAGGAENRFQVDPKTVQSFTVTILETEGEAGLTEVAAYSGDAATRPFIKVMDKAQTFLYDYWISPDGYQEFDLYTGGDVPAVSGENYVLSSSNENCSVSWQGDKIAVECPAGENCELSVSSRNGKVSDTVFMRNPRSGERAWNMFWLRVEETVMALCDNQRLHERMVICRLYTKMSEMMGSMFS